MIDIHINDTNFVRVQKSEFKGKERLDIRHFFINEEGKEIPTKKGVSIPMKQAEDFKSSIESLLMAEETVEVEG